MRTVSPSITVGDDTASAARTIVSLIIAARVSLGDRACAERAADPLHGIHRHAKPLGERPHARPIRARLRFPDALLQLGGNSRAAELFSFAYGPP